MKVLFAVILFGILFSGPVLSDQNPDQLDRLFAKLQQPDTTPQQGRFVTGEIWQQWMSIDDTRARELLVRGIREMNEFALNRAVDTFTELIGHAPDFAEAWNKRATVYYMMGRYKDATSDVAETLKREPRHFGALSGQGLIYFQTGRKQAALDWFRRALEINPFMDSVRQNAERLEQELGGRII